MVRAAALAVGLLAMSGVAQADPAPERQRELIHQLRHDCGSCHGMTLKGGLGPALLPAALAERPDDFLQDVILSGVPGKPMPPWRFEISESEAAWLVRQLKRGVGDGG